MNGENEGKMVEEVEPAKWEVRRISKKWEKL